MTVRWGILGAAKFAQEFMGPAIHAARGADLVALATASPEKAAPFQAFCPGLRVHDSYEALLNDPDVDAIYIPLPNHMHVDWTLKAVAAGKQVLCEKPMTLQASEFDALIHARDAAGVQVAEAFMIVHHPQWHHVRQLLADGVIGALQHVAGRFSFDNRDMGNIRNKAETGGGGLRDIGVYVLGSARFATGQEPQVTSARVRMENGVDVFAEVQAKAEAWTYQAYVSTRMAAAQEMVFHGDAGLIRLNAPFNPQVFGEARVELQQGAETTVRRFPAARQYVAQVEAFCAAVTDGVAFPCPLEFSRGTQNMMDAAFELAEDI